jgi:ribonuclease G
LIVQIKKDEMKHKSRSVTAKITFTGKYIILLYGNRTVGVSAKLGDKDRKAVKKRFLTCQDLSDEQDPGIKGLISTHKLGFILRTNALYADEIVLTQEIQSLVREFDALVQKATHSTSFSLLYEVVPDYLAVIRDSYLDIPLEIITDEETVYKEINDNFKGRIPDNTTVRLYDAKDVTLDVTYSIQKQLGVALSTKVNLKSGATIVIEATEAATVIDVNTAKATHRGKNVKNNFLTVNIEAAKEIARQIRLRNISGIIIVDFINMDSTDDVNMVLETMREAVSDDPVSTTVIDMTPLNLCEITRRKARKPLYEDM